MIKCLPCKTHNWGTKTGVQKQYLSIKNDHSGYVLFVEYQRILKYMREILETFYNDNVNIVS